MAPLHRVLAPASSADKHSVNRVWRWRECKAGIAPGFPFRQPAALPLLLDAQGGAGGRGGGWPGPSHQGPLLPCTRNSTTSFPFCTTDAQGGAGGRGGRQPDQGYQGGAGGAGGMHRAGCRGAASDGGKAGRAGCRPQPLFAGRRCTRRLPVSTTPLPLLAAMLAGPPLHGEGFCLPLSSVARPPAAACAG